MSYKILILILTVDCAAKAMNTNQRTSKPHALNFTPTVGNDHKHDDKCGGTYRTCGYLSRRNESKNESCQPKDSKRESSGNDHFSGKQPAHSSFRPKSSGSDNDDTESRSSKTTSTSSGGRIPDSNASSKQSAAGEKDTVMHECHWSEVPRTQQVVPPGFDGSSHNCFGYGNTGFEGRFTSYSAKSYHAPMDCKYVSLVANGQEPSMGEDPYEYKHGDASYNQSSSDSFGHSNDRSGT